MNLIKKTLSLLLMGSVIAWTFSGCEKTEENDDEIINAPIDGKYVLCLGVSTGSSTNNYYVVTTNELMSGTISSVNSGVEFTGYRQFQQGNQTIFSVGGLGTFKATAMAKGSNNRWQKKGNFVFDTDIYGFEQADANTMLAIEMPQFPQHGNKFKFRTLDINTAAFTKTSIKNMSELQVGGQWPWLTGTCVNEGKIYMTYYQADPVTFATANTDTTYVAVYSYPQFELITKIKDTRTGPAGSYNAQNGIFKDEAGDMYIMSTTAITNGFSQSTKKAAFLRIPKGATAFDDYFFDFEAKSGGLKPSHFAYIGNGLALVEVNTIQNQATNTAAAPWADKPLKSCIVNLRNQTITDVTGVPLHDGIGAGRFVALIENGQVYCPITTAEGIFIYKINPQTATAVKGAEIESSFITGLYKLD